MGGSSEKEKSASELQNLLKSYYSDIKGQAFQADNNFANYKTPFDYGRSSAELDKLNTQQIADVNRTAGSDINKVGQDTTGALASQGITGGSVLNDAVNKGRTGVLKNKYETISDITKNRTGQNLNLMQQENENEFRNTSADQNQKNIAIQQLLSKYGLLSNTSGQMQTNTSNLNDDTFWDDIFSGLNALSGFVPLIPGGGK